MNDKIAFIGAGKMASAIVKGLINNGIFKPSEIICTCGNDRTGKILAEETGIIYTEDLAPHLLDLKFLVLACKPQQLNEINEEIFKSSSNITLISILAGITLSTISKRFPNLKNYIRSMPNTPGQIGLGVTAYASMEKLTESEKETIENILASLGKIYAVEEKSLDAITAISGSGPAYVFEFISALTNAGIEAGLNEELAKDIAVETFIGSSQLLKQSTQSAEELRDAVTSPGGTTQAALNVFTEKNFRGLIKEAVKNAKERSIELSQE